MVASSLSHAEIRHNVSGLDRMLSQALIGLDYQYMDYLDKQALDAAGGWLMRSLGTIWDRLAQ